MALRSTMLILVAVILACHHAVHGGGGPGAVKPADSNAKHIANSPTVKDAILAELRGTNTEQNEYEVIGYTTRGPGTNYYLKIKIHSHPPAYIHARVWKNQDGTYQVTAVETGHTATDPIAYY